LAADSLAAGADGALHERGIETGLGDRAEVARRDLRDAGEHSSFAGCHCRQVGLAAELPTGVDEVGKRLLAGEDEDALILAHPEPQAALDLQHLHVGLGARAIVHGHALTGGAASDQERHPECAEGGVAARSMSRRAPGCTA
jgi:hypothetical protein